MKKDINRRALNIDFENVHDSMLDMLKSKIDVLKYDVNNPVDQKKILSMINEGLDRASKSIRRVIRKSDGPYIYDLDGVLLRRRKKALSEYIGTVGEKFGNSFNNLCIENEFVALNATPSFDTYDRVNEDSFINLGAAIWILDELYQSGKLKDALKFLVFDNDLLDEVMLPEMTDACHSEYIIKAMVYIINNRNEGQKGYDCDRVFIDTASAKNEYDAESQMRVRFDGIINLLRDSVVSRAVTRYEDKVWEYAQVYFECLDYYKVKEFETVNKFIPLVEKHKHETEKEKQDLKELMNGSIMFNPLINKPLDALMDKAGLTDTSGFQRHINLSREMESYAEKLNDLQEIQTCFSFNLSSFSDMSYNELKKDFDEYVADKFSDFSVQNPYETCFAFLYLLDIGNNLPWLYNQSLGVIKAAANKLPWNAEYNYYDDDDLFNDEIEEALDEISQSDDEELPPIDWIDEEAILYERKYKDDCLVLEKNMPEYDDSLKLNLPQIVFELTGLVMPRNVYSFADMEKELKKSGFKASETKTLERYFQLATSASQPKISHIKKMTENEFSKLSDGDTKIEKIDIEKQNARLKSEIEQLKQQLNEEHKELNLKKKEIEKIKENSILEHNELAELREFVLRSTKTDSVEVAAKVTLPYNVKHKMIVFGGHATWLKAIKEYLIGVKFVSPNTKPDISSVIHADMVWFQTNAIGHSAYNKVLDIARQNEIPVNYFSYASAEKCAEQLAVADIELE